MLLNVCKERKLYRLIGKNLILSDKYQTGGCLPNNIQYLIPRGKQAPGISSLIIIILIFAIT